MCMLCTLCADLVHTFLKKCAFGTLCTLGRSVQVWEKLACTLCTLFFWCAKSAQRFKTLSGKSSKHLAIQLLCTCRAYLSRPGLCQVIGVNNGLTACLVLGPRLFVYTKCIMCSIKCTQNKLFVWAGSIKTFGAKNKIEELIVQENVQGSTTHTWKGMTFYAVQCFRLSFSDWRSTFRIFLLIHKSVRRCSMSHQVSSKDREFYSN